MSNLNLSLVCLDLLLANALERQFRMPFDGYIKEVGLAVNIAPDGNNAVTIEHNGSAISGLAFALTTADVAGTTRVDKPTTLTKYRKGAAISVVTDGGGSAGEIQVVFTLEQA